jgi:hypothetical protein
MSHNVFANTWQVAGKAGMNKSIARFPDVCLSPPGPPAGPLPIPYPDTSFSSDLKEGSQTVKIGGQPAALAQQSYYKPPALGNEAATRSFGASVVTHQITGKTYFQAWSMDVKFEGKNVCRHIDITTSNHNSPPAATPPMPTVEMQAMPAQIAIDAGKCPCCGEALHAWQKDDYGNALKPISERDYWEKKIKHLEDEQKDKLASLPASKAKARAGIEAKLARFAEMRTKADRLQVLKDASRQKVKTAKAGGASPAVAAKAGCLNVNENDKQGCGTYFDTTDVVYQQSLVSLGAHGQTSLKTPSQLASSDFSSTQYQTFMGLTGDTPKERAIAMWEDANPPHKVDAADKMDHKTPKQAGGCNSAYNTVPRTWYSDPSDKSSPCTQVEDLHGELEKL